MIRPDGYVKVLDFGLAKLTDTTRKTSSGNVEFFPSGVNHTTPGMIMGTVSYMSPEQAEGLETDVRTDIWALGVMLYEMIAGKLPFKGPTPSHTIVAILEQAPEPLQNASPELQRIISTALQKDRALRFQTADAMSAAIDELKQRLGYISDKNITGPAPTARSIAATPPATRAPSPYRKLFWIVPAAFAVLLIGTIAVYSLVPWLSWLIEKGRQSADGRPGVDEATPTPAATVEATPYIYDYPGTPTPSPAAVYVDPTPLPIPDEPEPETPPATRPRARPHEPEPPRTRPKPGRTPVKKTPKQDPNCVFTNSCK